MAVPAECSRAMDRQTKGVGSAMEVLFLEADLGERGDLADKESAPENGLFRLEVDGLEDDLGMHREDQGSAHACLALRRRRKASRGSAPRHGCRLRRQATAGMSSRSASRS